MKKIMSILLLTLIIAIALTGCNNDQKQSFQSEEDFEKARIGIMLGSSFDVLAKEYFPEADKFYYMNIPDLILNLKQWILIK